MVKTVLVRYIFYIIECFEVPVLRKNRPKINKSIENIILFLWISFMIYISFHQLFGKNGMNSLKLNNNFTMFMVTFFHIESTFIYIFILLQKKLKNLHINEDKLWNRIENIDKMFHNYLQYKTIPTLRENQFFLWFTIDSILFAFFRILSLYKMSEENDFLYIIEIFSVSAILSLHLFKVKFYLIALNIRIECLNNCIREITFSQRRTIDVKPLLNIIMNYSKIVIAARVKASKVIYEEIVNISNMINEMFGVSLILLILYYLFDFTGNCYWVSYMILHDVEFLTWDLFYACPAAILLFELAIIAAIIQNNVCK